MILVFCGSLFGVFFFVFVNVVVGFVFYLYVIILIMYWFNVYDVRKFLIFLSKLFVDNGFLFDIY